MPNGCSWSPNLTYPRIKSVLGPLTSLTEFFIFGISFKSTFGILYFRDFFLSIKNFRDFIILSGFLIFGVSCFPSKIFGLFLYIRAFLLFGLFSFSGFPPFRAFLLFGLSSFGFLSVHEKNIINKL